VQALRSEGYAGAISLISEESEYPYDRPPLSKQVLTTGSLEPRQQLIQSGEAERLNVDLKLGACAAGLDQTDRVVRLADGCALPYGTLVIATGASARPSPWGNADGVFTLRTLADALALSEAFEVARDVAIVGAGLIGMEVASSAMSRGVAVTVVDAASGPLMRVVSPDVSARLTQWYEAIGVRLVLNCAIESIGSEDGRKVIRLRSGGTVTADFVVVAIGSQPNLGWLASSGLPIDDGVLADATGLVCGAGDVYAAGDVASWWEPDAGRHRRHEHWTRAVEQAPCVAHNVCHPDDRRTVTTPAYSWSDQFGSKLQMLGLVGGGKTRFVAGAGSDQWAALSDSDGELVGATFMNWPRGLAWARRTLAERGGVDELYGQLA
jgi:phthalate 3,4-dioxygenase ferredoxin reductase subunit